MVAILPSLVGFSNLTYLKTARTLRILRLLRMARLAKLAHTSRRKGEDPEDGAGVHTLSLQIYFATLASAVVVFGTHDVCCRGGDAS